MTKRQRTVAIYGLVCPTTDKVRYVGKSQNPELRFKQHLYIAQSKKYHQNTYVYRWLRELHQQGLEPRLVTIEETDENNWAEREQHWIAHYGLKNLCNMKDGGPQPPLHATRKDKMKRTNHYLTERQVKLLRMHSMQTGLSLAEIVRRCIDDGLEKAGFNVNRREAEKRSRQ